MGDFDSSIFEKIEAERAERSTYRDELLKRLAQIEDDLKSMPNCPDLLSRKECLLERLRFKDNRTPEEKAKSRAEFEKQMEKIFGKDRLEWNKKKTR